MEERVAHPRALSAFRIVLYVFAAAVALGFAAMAVGYLGLVVTVAGIGLLVTGGVNAVAVAALAVLGVLVASVAIGAVFAGARRIDRRVTRADRRPDPVEVAKRQYVAGDITEATLERELDRLMGGDAAARRRGDTGRYTLPGRHEHPDRRGARDERSTIRAIRRANRIAGDRGRRGSGR